MSAAAPGQVLQPPNGTPLENGIELALAKFLGEIVPPFPELMNARLTPAAFLPYLAADRGVEDWALAQTEEQQRAVVASAWEVKRLAGTRRAIKRALESYGYPVVSIESGRTYRQQWEALGGHVLDGAWRLDGQLLLDPPDGASRNLRAWAPSHWAQYAIHINAGLGEWSRATQAQIKAIAEAHGPLRSELVTLITSMATQFGRPTTLAAFSLRVRLAFSGLQRIQPLERRTLDGGWRLDASSAPLLLDGRWHLEGEPLTGAQLLGEPFDAGHFQFRQRVALRLPFAVGLRGDDTPPPLGGQLASLDGSRRLNALTLTGWPLDGDHRLDDAQFDRLALPRLDGTWNLGPRPRGPGSRMRGLIRVRSGGITTQEPI